MKSFRTPITQLSDDKLFLKDNWDAEEIGLIPHYSRSDYKLNFKRIYPDWLKETTKKFIRLQAATRTFSSCRSYLMGLSIFSDFLKIQEVLVSPQTVNRALMINFIHYLSTKQLSVTTRKNTLIHLRTFHLICLQEDWLPWPERPLVYASDFPKDSIIQPRYIPDNVLEQLKKHLHHLPDYKQRLVTILLETGRRISEICSLPYNCLEQDAQGDWYLKVHEKKLKRMRIIPISIQCLETIKDQQATVIASAENPI